MKISTNFPLAKISSCVITAAALAGCATMAPEYSRPTAPVPVEWKQTTPAEKPAAAAQKPVAEIPWREFMTDARLQKVVQLALDNNRDLKVATLTIERAQALYQIRRSELLPKVDATAAVSVQRIPADLTSSGRSTTSTQYSVGLGVVSYELDLFGRVRSLKDQALEQYLATEQTRTGVQISMVSQVAASWLTLAADRERLQLSRDTLVNQQAAYQLTRQRFDAGIASALTLSQARTTVEAARVDIARYIAIVEQDENALNLVVGSAVPAELLPQPLSEITAPVSALSPGLTSEVLLNRPDILQAENDLKSVNAAIGAARAAFFPRITLVSSIGLGSDELSGLFKGNSLAWSFAPRISLPIFDGGSNQSNLKVATADRDIAVARYEKAIQTAFREVADTLAQCSTIDEQLSAQQALTDATAESYSLSRLRFDKGVDSYLTVLDAQRSLYAAQQNLISTRLTRLNNQVTLYKVLGGGAK